MFMFNYETLVDPLLRDVRKCTPAFSGMKAGDRVLDVCCGTGAQVLEYGRHGIMATGIDISPDMLNIATRNRMKQKMVNVFFQLADAVSLPFPDGYFDYASVSLALHDKEKPVRYQIISEMKRVIKLNGALIFIDFQVPLPRNVLAVFARAIEFFAGGSHYQGFKDYLRSGGLEDILNNHGLREEGKTYLKSGLIALAKARIVGSSSVIPVTDAPQVGTAEVPCTRREE
jgi:ubiquinone/menaquinone biosynthesis C-methylase UbiE